MSFQNSDLFAIIIIVSIIILILGITLPFFIIISFRKKKLNLEEKAKMIVEFEAEILKTHIKAQEQTMQIIAADLHDNIGQLLSLISITLSTISVKEPEKLEKKIATSLSLANKSIKELRELTKLLHCEQIVEMGLANAIELEFEWLRKIGSYSLNLDNQILGISISSAEKDLIILRLLQEIINNLIKHAKATHVEINVFIVREILYINVKDNGVGFSYKEISTQKKGMGLPSIHKRIKIINGKIQIISNPSEGTLINIEIPYP